jgi:hypothetical protein
VEFLASQLPIHRASYGRGPRCLLVLEDFGDRLGRAWCETAEEDGNGAALLRHLIEGQYMHPARIVAFNTTQGWSRDVTADIADELRHRFVELELELAARNFNIPTSGGDRPT